jgi:hypothetical protein
MEIDILAVNGDVVVAIEVKSRLSQPDVERFCEKLHLFKRAFSDLYYRSLLRQKTSKKRGLVEMAHRCQPTHHILALMYGK